MSKTVAGLGAERPEEAAGHTAADGGPPRVDLGPLAGTVGFMLRRAQLAVFEEAVRAFAELELRPAQVGVLSLIGYRPGLKQSNVAAALWIQRANFVALADGLEERGLVLRCPVPGDRRAYALHLTEEGERLLDQANAIIAALEARFEARLGTGGRKRLLELLWRLADGC